MRIRATCHACGRDFLFYELRNTGDGISDRCPSCTRPLGVRGLLPVKVEQALAVLVSALEELARHNPDFDIKPASVLRPIEQALDPLTAPAAARHAA